MVYQIKMDPGTIFAIIVMSVIGGLAMLGGCIKLFRSRDYMEV